VLVEPAVSVRKKLSGRGVSQNRGGFEPTTTLTAADKGSVFHETREKAEHESREWYPAAKKKRQRIDDGVCFPGVENARGGDRRFEVSRESVVEGHRSHMGEKKGWRLSNPESMSDQAHHLTSRRGEMDASQLDEKHALEGEAQYSGRKHNDLPLSSSCLEQRAYGQGVRRSADQGRRGD